MDEVRKRTDSLASEYGTQITALQKELEESKKKAEQSKQETGPLESTITRLMKENAKLKLSEMSLMRKVQEFRNQIERERDTVKIKMNTTSVAAKQNFETERKEYENKIKSFRDSLIFAANDPRFERLNDDELIEQSIQKIREAMGTTEAKTLQEALHIKRTMGLGQEDSLLDVFQQLQKSVSNSGTNTEKLEKDISELQKKLDIAERENKRSEKSREELQQWNSWSVALYRQLTDTYSSHIDPSDIRFVIEEQVLASIGFHNTTRKSEILKAEKQLLLDERVRKVKPQKRLLSLRPLIMSTIFVRIVQSLSGTAAPKFAISFLMPHEQPHDEQNTTH